MAALAAGLAGKGSGGGGSGGMGMGLGMGTGVRLGGGGGGGMDGKMSFGDDFSLNGPPSLSSYSSSSSSPPPSYPPPSTLYSIPPPCNHKSLNDCLTHMQNDIKAIPFQWPFTSYAHDNSYLISKEHWPAKSLSKPFSVEKERFPTVVKGFDMSFEMVRSMFYAIMGDQKRSDGEKTEMFGNLQRELKGNEERKGDEIRRIMERPEGIIREQILRHCYGMEKGGEGNSERNDAGSKNQNQNQQKVTNENKARGESQSQSTDSPPSTQQIDFTPFWRADRFEFGKIPEIPPPQEEIS